MPQISNKRFVIISATAAKDLMDIWDYVAQFDENTASKLIKEVKNKLALLRDNPLIGREQNDYLINLRSFVVNDYFVFYIPHENGIDILRILHSSRDIESIFERFFDSISEYN